jgi:hypothetical protein
MSSEIGKKRARGPDTDTAVPSAKRECETAVGGEGSEGCGKVSPETVASSMLPLESDSAMDKPLKSDAEGDGGSLAHVHNPLWEGARSVECFERLNTIDEGAYGIVYRARDRATGE